MPDFSEKINPHYYKEDAWFLEQYTYLDSTSKHEIDQFPMQRAGLEDFIHYNYSISLFVLVQNKTTLFDTYYKEKTFNLSHVEWSIERKETRGI